MSNSVTQEFLDLLIEKGPGLRQAGYAHLVLGDVQITLHPHTHEYTAPSETSDEDQTDPLDDPAAYGLAPGSTLPWDEEETD